MTLKSELEAKAFIDGDIEGWDKVVRLSDVLAIVEKLEAKIPKLDEYYATQEAFEKADLLEGLCEAIRKTPEAISFVRGGDFCWWKYGDQQDSQEFDTPLAAIENLVETFKKEKE